MKHTHECQSHPDILWFPAVEPEVRVLQVTQPQLHLTPISTTVTFRLGEQNASPLSILVTLVAHMQLRKPFLLPDVPQDA